MNVLVIDHNAKYLDLIRSLIKEYLNNIQHIEFAQYLCDVDEMIHRRSPKLVISDLSLPDGRGADVLDALNERSDYVICLTSNAGYAVEAVRYHCVKDFLIKPVNIEEFRCSLKRFNSYMENNKKAGAASEYLIEKKVPQKLKYISNKSVEFIDLNNVVRIEAMRSYCKAILKNNRSIIYSKSLSKLEKELPEHMFFRVHKSHLINLSYVDEISRNGGFSIKMNDDTYIPLSRDKKKNFFSTFEYFIQ